MEANQPLLSTAANTVSGFGYIGLEEVWLFRLTNNHITVYITNYGATITAIQVPDAEGVQRNVVAGFTNLDNYLRPQPYLGCVVGRFANRIAGGKFNIGVTPFAVTVNNPPNHLHGGLQGLDKKIWSLENSYAEGDACGITLTCYSPDGEEGYPGNLRVSVSYTLTATNELQVQYEATTDKATIVNLTNHSYFNLSGFRSETIQQHLLQVFATHYAEKDTQGIPTGVLQKVARGPLDFRAPRMLKEVLDAFPLDGGIDHFFVIDKVDNGLAHAATLHEPQSGIQMEVWTDQPGCQVYTANFWDGSLTGGEGNTLVKHGAVAIETQNFPDAPNHPEFPSCLLYPEEVYRGITIFKFSTTQ